MIDFNIILKTSNLRWAGISIIALIYIILPLETGVNFWIRSALSAGLHKGEDPNIQVDISISWLGIKDIFRGSVKWIKINARNCKLNNLKYSRFQLDNRGFSFNLPVLLKKGLFQIFSVRKTRIKAVIAAKDLQDYLNFERPGYGLRVWILTNKIILTGRVFFLGKNVPVELEGRLTSNSAKMIRFYPLKLSIAGHPVSYGLLNLISNQLPLEFAIMEGLPLRITQIRLSQGNLFISLRELNYQIKR